MNIIQPRVELIDHHIYTPYQFIEKIGRTCYKSEDHITEDSAVKFVANLKKSKHYAMIEHFWVHLAASDYVYAADFEDRFLYTDSIGDITLISGPIRVFLEALDNDVFYTNRAVRGMLEALNGVYPEIIYNDKGLVHEFELADYRNPFSVLTEDEMVNYIKSCGPVHGISQDEIDKILMRHLPHTFKFTVDRGVTHEFVRHRPCSWSQESTRYCNYSKGKFGNEITVIEPLFFEKGTPKYEIWERACETAETEYFNLLNAGAVPQEARDVLPQSVKADIICTTNEVEWQHMVNLRSHGTTGAPHPQIKQVMDPCAEMLRELSEGRIK